MGRKLQAYDSVDTYRVDDSHLFVESDYGNYIAIKRNGTWELEPYSGTRDEYAEEQEMTQLRRHRCSTAGDLFGKTLNIKQPIPDKE